MSGRIHEYPLETPARLAFAVRWLGMGVAVGGGAGFLLALGASITLNEAFIDIWYDVDLDPLSRIVIPLLFVTVGVGLLFFGIGDSLYRWLLGRQLARSARATPELVPPHWQRTIVNAPAPLAAMTGVVWTVFGLAALVALAFFVILGETSDDEVAFVTGVAVGALLVAAAMIVAAVVLSQRKRRWPALVEDARAAWNRHMVRETETSDRQRRPRGAKVGIGAIVAAIRGFGARTLSVGIGGVVLGSAIGFFGVFLRQPCRRCDERSYDTFGEAVIDNLAVIGAAVTALGLVVLIVAGVAATAVRVVVDRVLRDGLAGLDAQRRPDGAELQARLAGGSLAEAYSILCSALGAFIATAALGVAAIDFPVDAAVRDGARVTGMALLAIALVLAYAGVGYNLRLRSQLRERWAPADIPVVKAARTRVE